MLGVISFQNLIVLALLFSVNAYPSHLELENLGKLLFFEKRLSVNNQVSCQSCHNISHSQLPTGTDGLSNSVGVYGRRGNRNAPTVWNASLRQSLFWDGRVKSLEEQAIGPILNHDEMGISSLKELETKLKSIKGYEKYFQKSFGDKQITGNRIALAIAEFEKSLLAKNSAFDRFLNGDTSAITESAKRGWNKFNSFSCIACHGAATFLEKDFFVRFPIHGGSSFEAQYNLKSDFGRYLHTKNHADINRWRVPSLRNVALTGPYLHNGSVKELKEVIRIMGLVQLNRVLKDQDINDIEAFLKSLTGEIRPIAEPQLPK